MAKYLPIIYNLLYFILFYVVMLIATFLFFKYYLKDFKFNQNKTKIYGIFQGLNNKSILAFTLEYMNYLFLVFLAMTTSNLNPVYISIIIMMAIIPPLITKNYLRIPISLIVSLIDIFAIYIISFVHTYLSGETSDILMRISIFLIIAFVFIYFTYNFINNIGDIAKLSEPKKEGAKSGNKKSS